MFSARAVFVAVSVVALTAMQAQAEEKEKEPLAIVEIGGSGGWTLSGDSSFGPTVGVEFEPIKNWLEIEIGTGPMFGNGIRERDTDILFKKPFTAEMSVASAQMMASFVRLLLEQAERQAKARENTKNDEPAN